MSGLSRRDFLKAGAASAAMAASGTLAAETQEIKIGLQLYSLRRVLGKDFRGTLEKVAKLGYQGVEFAGYYGYDRKPAELRKMLDDLGLVCCGTHTSINTLLGDNLKRTTDLHKTLGNPYLMVPGLPGKYRKGREGWLEAARLFNSIAAKLKPLEMWVGYHNHAHEFHKIGNETPWDIFFGNTVKDVCMQLDTGNCMAGGGDPVHYLKKYPGRALTVHAKEFGARTTVIGEGKVPWKEVIAACRSVGGTRWLIVEFDRTSLDLFECGKRCIENLKAML